MSEIAKTFIDEPVHRELVNFMLDEILSAPEPVTASDTIKLETNIRESAKARQLLEPIPEIRRSVVSLLAYWEATRIESEIKELRLL